MSQEVASKHLLKSKTLWANVLMAILAFFPGVAAFVSPEVLGAIFAVVNVLLRLITKDRVVLG